MFLGQNFFEQQTVLKFLKHKAQTAFHFQPRNRIWQHGIKGQKKISSTLYQFNIYYVDYYSLFKLLSRLLEFCVSTGKQFGVKQPANTSCVGKVLQKDDLPSKTSAKQILKMFRIFMCRFRCSCSQKTKWKQWIAHKKQLVSDTTVCVCSKTRLYQEAVAGIKGAV